MKKHKPTIVWASRVFGSTSFWPWRHTERTEIYTLTCELCSATSRQEYWPSGWARFGPNKYAHGVAYLFCPAHSTKQINQRLSAYEYFG